MLVDTMNILHLGNDYGTSKHRVDALRRLGHSVEGIDPEQLVPKGRLAAKLHWETGGLLCDKAVTASVLASLGETKFDCTLVNGGRYVGPSLIRELQRRYGPVLNYTNDDPFGSRDRHSWSLYRRAVPDYDLLALLREENIAEAAALGARKTLRITFSADEVAHAPRLLTEADHTRWDSDVVFVGTWMPERGPLMAELMRLGVPLSIYGGRWQKAKEWPLLQAAWKGPATATDDDYAKAIQCAKISLGLLSKGNRDLQTQRTFEVPALGTLLCAERTIEHRRLYCEGEEAVFWTDAAECAAVCFKLLNNESLRREIAFRGQLRCRQNGTLNEPILTRLLEQIIPGKSL